MPPSNTFSHPRFGRAARSRVLSSAAIAGALLTTLSASDAQAASQAHQNLPVSTMHSRWVSIPAGATYTWSTTDLSAGADTVMHLWDWSTTSEVGYDDDGGGGLASSVSYTNTTGSSKGLLLIVRSYSTSSQGTARLLQNGGTLSGQIAVGGRRITVENAAGYEHETVMAPGGANLPYLLALDSSLHLLDLDYTSGVGYQARVEHPNTQYVVVGTTSGSGNVHLYSNDPTDNDGDGVGYGLEWDLGTCDVAWWGHCGDVHNLADTDRDAIPDGAEVFGIDDTWEPQHLPAWGADPLHKDVFVELDWSDAFPGQPFTEADAVAADAIFMAGDNDAIINPDTMHGVRIHLDVGFEPADPSLVTLMGDWGGANEVPDGTAYGSAPDTYRDPVRAGIFHYGLLNQGSGGGQGWRPGDRFNWGVSMGNRYVRSFAHELGHNLNLRHSGHPDWGNVNGKANYLSLMNYAYPGSNFSQGDSNIVLNPAFVDEQAGIGADASHVGVSPFYRDIGPMEEIDWDFDGEFSDGGWAASRAPVTYATWSGTNAFTQNEQELHNESDLPATTPALIRGPSNRMYAFYVDDDRIYYRHALVDGNSWDGSCPGGDEPGETCTTWSGAIEVPTGADARGLTAIYAEGQVLLAFRTEWDSLRTVRATGVDGSGTLTGWTNETFHSVWTDKEPEAQFMRVDPGQFAGENLVVGLFYRDKNTGQYRWRTMANVSSIGSTDRGALTTETGGTLYGTESPTFTNWPYDPMTSVDGTTCGAITDTTGQVGMYCYDRAANHFENLSPSAFPGTTPTTVGKPGLAFHSYRSWAGVPKDGEPGRGAFWLSVINADDKWDFADMWISDPISESPGEDLGSLYFPSQRRGKVGNVWSNMVDGSGLALCDDPQLGAMKGLWLRQDGADTDNPPGAVKLRFLPFADGGYRAFLTDGNDFEVMERGICRGLADDAYCGPSSFGLD